MDLFIELICTVGKTEQGGGREEKENSALRLHSQVTILGSRINCRMSTITSPKFYFQVDCVPLQRKAAQRHDQETSQGVQGGTGETQKQSRRKCTANFFPDVT